MINLKEQDWVLNLLGNLHLSPADLYNSGLTAENTSFLSEDTYKQSLKILDNPLFKDEEGNFSDSKFHEFYELALLAYNMLANDTYMQEMTKQLTVYGKDDIFAPREQRAKFSDTVVHFRAPNPDRTTTGLVRFGQTEAPKWSREENAQTQKVLANPTEVYDENGEADWTKAVWHDSPNDSYFTDFWDTRVLAQYDSDGEHIDPITGEKVQHKKGELRLNENGTYFYENLDGRDIYGRLVLNKMNTLTRDGSFWNDYDFFDSDDLELKSVGGSIMKNLALVGTMFIPYVGPWVAGISVASLLAGLSATLGKMFLGSDSPTLSAIEGWSKSVNRQTAKSQYAQENIWCWENFINLIGDVAGQLKELRFIFEYAPALFKGTRALDAKGMSVGKLNQWIDKKAELLKEFFNTKIDKLGAAKKLTAAELTAAQTALANTKFMATKDMERFLESYQHIGSVLSKGYMTAVTVGDTFGEAKYEAGASDTEAMLLTLGYAAAEAALLNSPIGEWILPELKASGLKRKAIIKALTEVPDEMRIKATKHATEDAVKKGAKYWFNKGKEIATNLSVVGKGLAGQAIAGGLSEGFEEVSEEFLADFSKACFNFVLSQRDKEGRMSAWENMSDRYLMSLLGGGIGGGLTAVGTDFKIANHTYTSLEAAQEMIYMLRQGEKKNLLKTLKNMDIANPYLKTAPTTQSDGTVVYEAANKRSESMDADIKNAFILRVEAMDAIIKSEGLKVPDSEFLDKQTFDDIKLAALQHSPVASGFLLDFNSLCADIFATKDLINNINASYADSKQPSEDDVLRLSNLKIKLNELIRKKDLYLTGELAMDFVSKALFDLNASVTQFFTTPYFKLFAEAKTLISFDKIPMDEKKKLREEFDNWSRTERKNVISSLAPVYLSMARRSRDFVNFFTLSYDQQRKNTSLQALLQEKLILKQSLNQYSGLSQEGGQDLDFVLEGDENVWLLTLNEVYRDDLYRAANLLIATKGSELVKLKLQLVADNHKNLSKEDPDRTSKENALSREYADIVYNEIINNLDLYYDDFIQLGVINPEIKHSLKNTLASTQNWIKNINSYLTNVNSSDKFNYELSNDTGSTVPANSSITELLQNMSEDKLAYYLNGTSDLPKVLSLLLQIATALNIPNVETLSDIDKIKETVNQLATLVDQKMAAFDLVTYTDTLQFVLNFIQTNSDSELNLTKLLDTINGLIDLNLGSLGDINLEGLYEQLKEAIEVIGWTQGIVAGAVADEAPNLGNLTGYNVTLNQVAKKQGVQDWEELPEISSSIAHVMLQDLELVKSKLIAAKNLYQLNLGKKLNHLRKVATNKDFITYNRINKWITTIGDEWKEKEKLQEAISNAESLKKFAEERNLNTVTPEVRKVIRKEMIAIEDAIYDFFNTNSKLIPTLFENGFDLFHGTNLLINEGTEVLDDRNFVWYLASRAAIKRSEFNNEFRLIITDQVAPIPTLEEAVYHNLAAILNGDKITEFLKAYNKTADKKFRELSKEDKIEVLKGTGVENAETLLNVDILPEFTNIYLTEGIPGAGKSKAVDYYTVKLLKTFHKDLLNNVWLAHGDTTRAGKLANDLELESPKLFDKVSLMKTVYSNYKEVRDVDNEGNVLYDPDEWIKDSEGKIVFKDKSDDLAEEHIPSLIIIDEVSHYDLAELSILNDFARKNGITIITSGDFDLSSITASSPKYGTKGLTLTPTRNLFMHSPKLGVSMRTTNSLMDKTINAYLAWLLNGKERSKTTLKTYYYEGEEGLNGVKTVSNVGTKENELEIKGTIDLMVSTLKEGEKIGFIYWNPDSKVLKMLEEKYPDKFEKFHGTSAQGLEGQYYIFDTSGATRGPEELDKDYYTSITRAAQGALVVSSELAVAKNNNLLSIKEDATTVTATNPKLLGNEALETKKMLNELNSTNETIKYIPRKANKVVTVIPPAPAPKPVAPVPVKITPKAEWSNPEAVKEFTLRGEKYISDGNKVGKYTDDTTFELLEEGDSVIDEIRTIYKNLSLQQEELTLEDETSEETTGENVTALNSTVVNIPVETIQESEDGELENFTYLLHSHNTFELGIRDNNGRVEFLDKTSRYQYRIDSVIGLLKIFEADWKNPVNSTEYYINKLADIRGYIFSIPDKVDLINHLNAVFNPNEDNELLEVRNIEFGLISTPRINKPGLKWGYEKESKYGIFDKHVDERTINNANQDATEINRKAINAIITLANGKKVAIPLFVLGNLETYTRNPQSEIAMKLKELYDDNGQVAGYNFHKAILEDDMLKDIPEIANLAKLFIFTSGGYFKIDDPNWTPAKNLTNWGIQINTDSISGRFMEYQGADSFTPISSFTSMSGLHFSKQIYTALQAIEDDNGNLIDFGHKGHAFVLVSLDPRLNTDEALKELYEKQLLNPKEPKKVTLIYVMPPKVSVRDYLENLHSLINEKDENRRKSIKKLGSHLTSYYIWKSLLPRLDSPMFNKIDQKTKEKIRETVERLMALDSPSDILNAVMANEEWTGVSTGQSIQSILGHLNYLLLNLFSNVSDSTIVPEYLNELVSAIEDTGLTNIFYSVKFKEGKPGRVPTISALESDLDVYGNSLYTIGGLPFSVNAKIDSNLFSANKEFNKIIESFVNKIKPADEKVPREYSADTWNFVNPPKVDKSKVNETRITLEENDLNLEEIRIQFTPEGTLIQGVPSPLTELQIKNYKFRTKLEIEQELNVKGLPAIPSYVDKLYAAQIDGLYRANLDLYNNTMGSEITNYLSWINAELDGNVGFFANGKIIHKEFSREELQKVGLESISIMDNLATVLKYDVSGVAEYPIKGGKLIFNKNTESISLEVEGKEPIPNEYYDNMDFSLGSPVMDLFERIGYREKFNEYKDMYEFMTVADIKGSEVVDELNELLELFKQDLELKDLLNYLNEDSEYCIRVLKGK